MLWGLGICETVQNQSRKISVIGLPKFTTVNMDRQYPQHVSFSIENLFFEDFCFGSLMTDVFLTDTGKKTAKARKSMELLV